MTLNRFLCSALPQRHAFSLCVFAGAIALSHGAAAAFPERPIRLISVGAPGGTPDILSRRIGAGLSEVFKKQIDNT